jgi:TrmH family RNA methyltransferase
VEHISSRQNAVVKRFRELARSGAGEGLMLLDGAHLIEEALASGVRLEVVAFGERHVPGRLATLLARVRAAGAHAVSVTDAVLAALSPVQNPSGVAAIAQRRAVSPQDVFGRPPQLVLMLSDVQDPGNVGAIVRAAEGCGATGVVIGEGSADPFGWKALRGSMGSAFRVPLAIADRLAASVRDAKNAGLRVFATVPRAGTPLPAADLRGAAAILLGGEGPGLPQALLDAADDRLTIPMRPPVESLNVAIAAAVILYEASRQRSHVTL